MVQGRPRTPPSTIDEHRLTSGRPRKHRHGADRARAALSSLCRGQRGGAQHEWRRPAPGPPGRRAGRRPGCAARWTSTGCPRRRSARIASAPWLGQQAGRQARRCGGGQPSSGTGRTCRLVCQDVLREGAPARRAASPGVADADPGAATSGAEGDDLPGELGSRTRPRAEPGRPLLRLAARARTRTSDAAPARGPEACATPMPGRLAAVDQGRHRRGHRAPPARLSAGAAGPRRDLRCPPASISGSVSRRCRRQRPSHRAMCSMNRSPRGAVPVLLVGRARHRLAGVGLD
jgi:hypothetical protein